MVLQLYSRKDVLCHVESKWTTCTCSCAKFMRKMFKTFKYVATTNGKGRDISFYKFEFPSPKDDWAKFVWNPLGQWFWRRFLAAHDVFSYSATVFLWEMVWPFNLKKLKLSSPRCFVSRWVWIVQEEFLKIVNLFSLFYYNYLPLVKSVILQQKLEFHSIKDTLCLVWLKLAQWFWRDRLIWYIFKKRFTTTTTISTTACNSCKLDLMD